MGVTKTEPEDGAILDKAPEAVQVWYTQEPDAAVSKVSMSGPNGEVALFVHPGKDKSLMGMVQDKDLADGEYVVKWQTSGDDGHIQKGEYKSNNKVLGSLSRSSRMSAVISAMPPIIVRSSSQKAGVGS